MLIFMIIKLYVINLINEDGIMNIILAKLAPQKSHAAWIHSAKAPCSMNPQRCIIVLKMHIAATNSL